MVMHLLFLDGRMPQAPTSGAQLISSSVQMLTMSKAPLLASFACKADSKDMICMPTKGGLRWPVQVHALLAARWG